MVDKHSQSKQCHFAGCQAGYIILDTAPFVEEVFNLAHSEYHTPEYKTLYFHPGCHKAAHD